MQASGVRSSHSAGCLTRCAAATQAHTPPSIPMPTAHTPPSIPMPTAHTPPRSPCPRLTLRPASPCPRLTLRPASPWPRLTLRPASRWPRLTLRPDPHAHGSQHSAQHPDGHGSQHSAQHPHGDQPPVPTDDHAPRCVLQVLHNGEGACPRCTQCLPALSTAFHVHSLFSLWCVHCVWYRCVRFARAVCRGWLGRCGGAAERWRGEWLAREDPAGRVAARALGRSDATRRVQPHDEQRG
jgi:hypothetical protein